MHALAQLLLNFLQLLSHSLADRHAPHSIRPVPILPANMREAKEVEGLRLAFSSLHSLKMLSSESLELPT
jgi:hypothetical protein